MSTTTSPVNSSGSSSNNNNNKHDPPSSSPVQVASKRIQLSSSSSSSTSWEEYMETVQVEGLKIMYNPISRIAFTHLTQLEAYVNDPIHKDDDTQDSDKQAKRAHAAQVLEAIRHDLVVINTGCIQVLQEFSSVLWECHEAKRAFWHLDRQAAAMTLHIQTLGARLETVAQERNASQKELHLMQYELASMYSKKANDHQQGQEAIESGDSANNDDNPGGDPKVANDNDIDANNGFSTKSTNQEMKEDSPETVNPKSTNGGDVDNDNLAA